MHRLASLAPTIFLPAYFPSSSHVVKGRYPDRLLRSWSRFADEEEDSENICPKVFGPSQLYAVLILAEGGPDLEHAKLTNWCQASSIFWQVADALAAAEEACQFEVRANSFADLSGLG